MAIQRIGVTNSFQKSIWAFYTCHSQQHLDAKSWLQGIQVLEIQEKSLLQRIGRTKGGKNGQLFTRDPQSTF